MVQGLKDWEHLTLIERGFDSANIFPDSYFSMKKGSQALAQNLEYPQKLGLILFLNRISLSVIRRFIKSLCMQYNIEHTTHILGQMVRCTWLLKSDQWESSIVGIWPIAGQETEKLMSHNSQVENLGQLGWITVLAPWAMMINISNIWSIMFSACCRVATKILQRFFGDRCNGYIIGWELVSIVH